MAASNTDALDEWLADPVVQTHLDPIAYWPGMQAAGHPLARMALDFLSIPGRRISDIFFLSRRLLTFVFPLI